MLPIIVRTTDFLCCVKRRAVWTLLLCRGTSGSAHEVTHTRCLTDAWKIWLLRLVACLPAGCLVNEGARESSSRLAVTPAKYHEGTLATNHNATTGERGYHDKERRGTHGFAREILACDS